MKEFFWVVFINEKSAECETKKVKVVKEDATRYFIDGVVQSSFCLPCPYIYKKGIGVWVQNNKVSSDGELTACYQFVAESYDEAKDKLYEKLKTILSRKQKEYQSLKESIRMYTNKILEIL